MDLLCPGLNPGCCVQEAVLREEGARHVNLEQLDILCSFTVPAMLLNQHERGTLQHLQTWLDCNIGSPRSTCQGRCPWDELRPMLWGLATYEVKRSVQRICL